MKSSIFGNTRNLKVQKNLLFHSQVPPFKYHYQVWDLVTYLRNIVRYVLHLFKSLNSTSNQCRLFFDIIEFVIQDLLNPLSLFTLAAISNPSREVLLFLVYKRCLLPLEECQQDCMQGYW